MASLRKALPAGQLDSGLASLGTFIVGLYAASTFEAATLGGYAIVFSAFVLAAEVPAELVYTPGEIIAVERDLPARRLMYLRSTIGAAMRLAVPTGAVVALSAFLVSDAVPAASVWALATMATVNAVVSPMQDHLRRMLHIADASWRAAQVSVVNVTSVVGALVIFNALDLVALAPFGALLVANVLSIAFGWIRASPPRPEHRERLRFREFNVIGRWLMVVGMASAGAGLAITAIVQALAGPEALGHAEGARVVGRPIQVIAIGLLAVFGPRLMEAAVARNGRVARRRRWQFALLSLAVGAPYTALVAAPWAWNPLGERLAIAYAVPGLVLITAVANVLQNLSYPHRSELGGSRQQVKLAVVEVVSNTVQLAVAFSAVAIGAFAIPVSMLVGAILRLAVYQAVLHRYYFRARESRGRHLGRRS